jgi:hypothetical protein
MRITSIVCASLLAVGALAAPATSQARTDFFISVAPPPPRVEVVPRPRHGYAWSPGYWRWSGHRHVWVRGNWVRERRGWHWVPAHWVANGPRWHYVPGYWAR